MAVKHTIRRPGGKTREVSLTPVQAIRKFCEECVGWEDVKEGIKNCTELTCPLYPFRLARNPSRAGMGPGKKGVK